MNGTKFDKFDYLKRTRGMPASQRSVLVEIFNYSNRSGLNAFPGIDQLAEDCDMSRSTVKRNLRWLETNGWLSQQSRGGRGRDGEGRASVYNLTYGSVPERPRTTSEIVSEVITPPADEKRTEEESEPITRNMDSYFDEWEAKSNDLALKGREIIESGKYAPALGGYEGDNEPPF